MTVLLTRKFRSFLQPLASQVHSGSRFVSSWTGVEWPLHVIQTMPLTVGGCGAGGEPAVPGAGITNWWENPVLSMLGRTSPVSFS